MLKRAYTHTMDKRITACDFNQCREIGQTCAVFNLRKASRVVTQLYDEIMKPSGILPTQFTLLVATRARGPVTITNLAEVLVMDRTTLTRNLKPLVKQGLISVEKGKQDQRSRVVKLTEKGLRQLDRALPLWKEAQHRMRRALGDSGLKQLLDDLQAVVDVT